MPHRSSSPQMLQSLVHPHQPTGLGASPASPGSPCHGDSHSLWIFMDVHWKVIGKCTIAGVHHSCMAHHIPGFSLDVHVHGRIHGMIHGMISVDLLFSCRSAGFIMIHPSSKRTKGKAATCVMRYAKLLPMVTLEEHMQKPLEQIHFEIGAPKDAKG